MLSTDALLPIALVLLTAVLARRFRGADSGAIGRVLEARWFPIVPGLLTMAFVWWLWGSLAAEPVVHDEAAYLLQARIFALGRWASPAPPLPEFFEQFHVFVTPTLAPKYPPGHALLMVPGVWLGFPGLVPVLLSGISAALLFALARRMSNGVIALAAWLFWLFAPLGLRYRATYFSETTTELAWLASWWALWQYHRDGRRRWLVALTAFVAWGGITRPYTMIAFAVPVGAVALWLIVKRKRWGDLGAALPVGLAIVALTPLWSQRTLGSWRSNPYTEYSRVYFPFDKLGFGFDSTPPKRALPPDFERYTEHFRPFHAAHQPANLPTVLGTRLTKIANDAWSGRVALMVLAGVGVLTMSAEVAVAAVCALALFAAYAFKPHEPIWTLYYFEAQPIIAFLTALGLWRIAVLLTDRAAWRQAPRAPASLAPAVVVFVGLLGLVPAWNAVAQRLRAEGAARRLYFAQFDGAVASIRDPRAIVFVRYDASHVFHFSVIRNGPDPATARIWTVYDRGTDNARLLAAAPDRVPYLYEERLVDGALVRTISPLPRP
jgi:4-amino-4-deoxy-L-arabinose transferase-like glycosyltransferase